MDSILQSYFNFATFVEALKKIERYKGQFYWTTYAKLPRYDSVAEHTWRMTLLVLLFENKLSKKINVEKAFKMAIIHDLPEVIAGDAHPMGTDGMGKGTYATDPKLYKEKLEKEQKGAKELFYKITDNKGKELYDLWQEYERQDCFEAQVVKAIDRIEMLLQVFDYRKDSYIFTQHAKFNVEYALKWCHIDPFIESFANYIAAETDKIPHKELPKKK